MLRIQALKCGLLCVHLHHHGLLFICIGEKKTKNGSVPSSTAIWLRIPVLKLLLETQNGISITML